MKTLRWHVATTLALGLSLSACGGAPAPVVAAKGAETPAPPAEAADAFRAKAPDAGPEIAFTPPVIHETRLKSGMRVLIVEQRDLPVVALQVAFDHGAAQAAPGIGSLVAAMLERGTKKRSAIELGEAFLRLGAHQDAFATHDELAVSARALASSFDEVLDLVGEMIMTPAFARPELERERSRRLTALGQRRDRPDAVLADTVAELLYPEGHPYAANLLGNDKTLGAASVAELARFHGAHVRPDRATVSIAGDIDRADAVAAVERVFGAWTGSSKPGVVPAAPPHAKLEQRVVIVDRPGSTQSQVAVTLPGVPRRTEDFEAILVMNTMLGGQFSSRLNLNLREKHAYTYGARSSFDMRHGPGPFTAGGAMLREHTGAAVREVLAEIERMRSEPVGEEELDSAKQNLLRQMPARFETTSATAGAMGALSVYGLPLDDFAARPARIRAVKAEDVQRVARRLLDMDKMRVVVVGDAEVIEAQLAGLELGPMDVRRAPKAPAVAQTKAAAPR